MEHLYEFDLIGIMLMDEEKIYGVAIGSIYDNVAFLHLNLSLHDINGLKEESKKKTSHRVKKND